MTLNNQNRFIIDVEETTQENAVFEFGNFVCFADDTDSLVDKLNEISGELAFRESKYIALEEAHFTQMGGFTMERDGRGRYNICSGNVIPKNAAIIRIAAPDAIWNSIVANIFNDLLKIKGQ